MIRRLLLLTLATVAYANCGWAQDISVRYQGQLIGSRGVPLVSQNIAVCTQPAVTSTQPCSPLATLATSTTTSSGGANPLTTDSNGNFFFYAAPGKYTVQAYGPQVSGQFVQPDTLVGAAGTITCTFLNAVRCVSPSNPQGWAGSDVGAWINSAYANCAAANLTVCPIQVATGAYPASATLINFSTLNVYPYLQCAPQTTITFSSTSGTAITLNPGRAGLPTDWGISGCKFIGSGIGNTLTGILSGGTNGAVGAALRGIEMSAFNIALSFSTNVQGWVLDHAVITDNNQNLVVPANLTLTGEGIILSNNTFSNTTAVWSATCISIGNSSGTFYNFQFIGGSIDQCGVSVGNGSHTVFNQVHWENPQSVAMSAAYLTCSGGVCTVNGNLFVSEQAGFNPGCSVVSSCFIDSKTGAAIITEGNEALNSGNSAMSGFVHICATCTGTSKGNIVSFGTQSLPPESIDTGGQLGRLSPNSVTIYGGNNTSGSSLIANSGQTISGITGTLFGFLQPGVAHLGEIDTSGNLGMLGALHQNGSALNVPTVIASGTSTLNSGALATNTCQATVTTSATGAAATDAIEWSFATVPASADGLTTISAAPTANNVNFVRCNASSVSQTTTAIVINWRVIR